MNVTDIFWLRDRRGREILQLRLDGHLAHIPSKQRTELLRRGLVKGMDYLARELEVQASRPYIQRAVEPGLVEPGLAGCIDDPVVFALYQEMSLAIAANTWRSGSRGLCTASSAGAPSAGAPPLGIGVPAA